jgi:hypothetical protein
MSILISLLKSLKKYAGKGHRNDSRMKNLLYKNVHFVQNKIFLNVVSFKILVMFLEALFARTSGIVRQRNFIFCF